MEIKYQIEDLEHVLNFFAKAYASKDGKEVSGFEYFIDVGKKKVVFKLFLKPKQ